MILERTAAGLRARAQAGGWPGGPPPFGFKLERGEAGTRLALHEPEAEVLRTAAGLIIDDGHTTWTAARVLNGLGLKPRKGSAWVHNRLRKVLLSPTLGGEWTYGSGESAVRVEIPRVLEPDRHAELLDALRATAAAPRRPEGKREYLLSRGRLFGSCGATYHGVWRRERASRAYRCANSRPEADPRCLDHNINADLVEEAVWGEVDGAAVGAGAPDGDGRRVPRAAGRRGRSAAGPDRGHRGEAGEQPRGPRPPGRRGAQGRDRPRDDQGQRRGAGGGGALAARAPASGWSAGATRARSRGTAPSGSRTWRGRRRSACAR